LQGLKIKVLKNSPGLHVKVLMRMTCQRERGRERERERVGMVIEYTVTVAVPRANDGSERVVDVEL
jgi:hypothetical protein